MLSYRLPLKRSIVTPPSSCPHCHHNLAARDLIPIFSWVLSRGKCRYCGVAISPRYPLIELAMACGSAAAFALIGVQPWLFVILLGLVIVATVMTICIENARD
jgi:leader peptidase (prepilin peptidase)/N-methyltransferase